MLEPFFVSEMVLLMLENTVWDARSYPRPLP